MGGVAGGLPGEGVGGGGVMLKLRFDWYLSCTLKRLEVSSKPILLPRYKGGIRNRSEPSSGCGVLTNIGVPNGSMGCMAQCGYFKRYSLLFIN